MSLLEDSGFKVNAIDLTGSGIQCSDTNKISSLSEYAEPLTSYLKGLGDSEKVCSLHILIIICVVYFAILLQYRMFIRLSLTVVVDKIIRR